MFRKSGFLNDKNNNSINNRNFSMKEIFIKKKGFNNFQKSESYIKNS